MRGNGLRPEIVEVSSTIVLPLKICNEVVPLKILTDNPAPRVAGVPLKGVPLFKNFIPSSWLVVLLTTEDENKFDVDVDEMGKLLNDTPKSVKLVDELLVGTKTEPLLGLTY